MRTPYLCVKYLQAQSELVHANTNILKADIEPELWLIQNARCAEHLTGLYDAEYSYDDYYKIDSVKVVLIP